MASRTLSQVINELNPTYKPQIASVRAQQAMIPQNIANETKGLEAKQTQAFDTILGGARQRGLGFSGIPLAEQAKYASTEFLPAVARLQQQGNEQKLSLEQAILGIRERRDTLAQTLLQQYKDRAEQKRQFNLSLEEQRKARAAAGSGGGSFAPSMGDLFGGGDVKGDSNGDGKVTNADKAYTSVQKFMGKGRKAAESDYQAALAWYKKTGNPVDRLKVQLYKKQGIGQKDKFAQQGVNSGGLTSYGYSKNGSGLTGGKGITFGY